MDERTRKEIISKYGKEPLPNVAFRYGVSKDAVRRVWAEEHYTRRVRTLSE